MSNESTKSFLCDAMLGKLATWLRILGYDAAYMDSSHTGAALVEKAIRDQRTLLTRNMQLLERRTLKEYGKYLFIREDYFRLQLKQVVMVFGLKPDAAGTRCNRCNVRLEEISLSDLLHILPPYVAATQRDFKRCPECCRIYWPATHCESMQNEIADIFDAEDKK